MAAGLACAIAAAASHAQVTTELVYLDGIDAIDRGPGPAPTDLSIRLGANSDAVFTTRRQGDAASTLWRWSPGTQASPIGPVPPQYDGVSGVGAWPGVTAVNASGDAVIVDRGVRPDGGVGFIFAELAGDVLSAAAATGPMAVGPGVLSVDTSNRYVPLQVFVHRHGFHLGRLYEYTQSEQQEINELISIVPGRGARLHRTPGTPVPGGIGMLGDMTNADRSGGWQRRGAFTATYDITPSGDVVYFSSIVEQSGDSRGGGIFWDGPQGLRVVARNDILDPSIDQFYRARGLRATDSGRIVFSGSVIPAGEPDELFGLWNIDPAGDITPIVLDGEYIYWEQGDRDLRITASGISSSKQAIMTSESGDTLFIGAGSYFGPPAPGTAMGVNLISVKADGSRSVVLQEYSGMPAGLTPYSVFQFDLLFGHIMAPDALSALMVAVVRDHGTAVNTPALIVAHADHGIHEIVRRYDMFEVAPGDLREVNQIEALEHQAGAKSLFRLRFTDGSSGVFYTTATAPACPADLNKDGVVDADDFFLFLQFFAAGDPRADINGDGVIDTDDFFEYLDLFAQGC
ncbi:MAG: hypothetical protein JJU33_04920 [Phycisphaerales bacterium]|nr:hypothetical protein [Phycisphaerales bacterium]